MLQDSTAVKLAVQSTISEAHMDRVTSLCWSDCVNQLASVSSDCLVKLWDFTKSTPPQEVCTIDMVVHF